jgi:hypothetical protein
VKRREGAEAPWQGPRASVLAFRVVSRWVAVLAALATGTACAGRAFAQPATVPEVPLGAAIDVTAGATCLDAARLEGQVGTWLGRTSVPAGVRVHVRGDERDPRAVAFAIERHGKAYERRFDQLPEDCADATAVIGLAVALAVDANALRSVLPPPEEASKPRRALLALQVGAGFQVMPAASVGPVVGVEVGLLDWLGARVDAFSQFSWGNSIEGTTGVFDTALAAAVPQLCAGGAASDRVVLELCSGAGFGVLHAQGRGYAVSRSATGSWVVAVGGIRLIAKLGIPWVVDLGAVLPLRVPAFRADTSLGPSYLQPSPAGTVLMVGPGLLF